MEGERSEVVVQMETIGDEKAAISVVRDPPNDAAAIFA